MDKFKIEIKAPKLTDEEILQRQNFKDVLNKSTQTNKINAKLKKLFWGASGIAVITAVILGSFFINKKDEISLTNKTSIEKKIEEPVKTNEIKSLNQELSTKKLKKESKNSTPSNNTTIEKREITTPLIVNTAKSTNNKENQIEKKQSLNIAVAPISQLEEANLFVTKKKNPIIIDKKQLIKDISLYSALTKGNELCRVKSFELKFTSSQNKTVNLKSTNNKLTPSMIRAIHNSDSSDNILFHNVIGEKANGEKVKVKNVESKIVEGRRFNSF